MSITNKGNAPAGSGRLRARLISSGMQAVGMQVLGTVFFYLLAMRLTKSDIGYISWANSLTAFIVTLLSAGLEQIVVRRIAANRNASWPAAVFLMHAFITSLATVVLLLIIRAIGGHQALLSLFILYFGVQALIYLTAPLKQYLNASGRFTPYGILAIVSNSIKIILLLILSHTGRLSVESAGWMLLGTGFFELAVLLAYILRKTPFVFRINARRYGKLVHEAIPQFASVLFDSGLARADWILMGWLSTAAATGEYAFAYRGFEMSRLPLAAIGPLLINAFARLAAGNKIKEHREGLQSLLYAEISGAAFVALLAALLWAPVVGAITGDKYGASNASSFSVLVFCLPLFFAINFFWSLCFTARLYRKILFITGATAVLNILFNLLLIPLLGGTGAAFAFLGSTMFQVVCYAALTQKAVIQISVLPLLMPVLLACLLFAAVAAFKIPLKGALPLVFVIYPATLIFTRAKKSLKLAAIKNLLKA